MDKIKIATLLTEAAELLDDDYKTLNEGVSSTLKLCALIISAIGLGVWIHMDDKKEKKLKEEKEKEIAKKREEEDKKKEKECKAYIDTISKKELNLSSKEDLMKSIFSDIKTIVSAMKKDKKYYSKIKEDVKKVLAEGSDDYFDGLICRLYDEKYGYEIIEIINGSQMIRTKLGYVINDIAYIIKKKYTQPIKDFNLKISTGDGDEGCFYMD